MTQDKRLRSLYTQGLTKSASCIYAFSILTEGYLQTFRLIAPESIEELEEWFHSKKALSS
jgi:hypothetical protein